MFNGLVMIYGLCRFERTVIRWKLCSPVLSCLFESTNWTTAHAKLWPIFILTLSQTTIEDFVLRVHNHFASLSSMMVALIIYLHIILTIIEKKPRILWNNGEYSGFKVVKMCPKFLFDHKTIWKYSISYFNANIFHFGWLICRKWLENEWRSKEGKEKKRKQCNVLKHFPWMECAFVDNWTREMCGKRCAHGAHIFCLPKWAFTIIMMPNNTQSMLNVAHATHHEFNTNSKITIIARYTSIHWHYLWILENRNNSNMISGRMRKIERWYNEGKNLPLKLNEKNCEKCIFASSYILLMLSIENRIQPPIQPKKKRK